MKPHALVLAAALQLVPVIAAAQGASPAPSHGGQVQKMVGHWVELVLSGDQLTVFVNEPDNKPLPTKEWGGKATVLVGGKTETVTLSAGQGDSASGKLGAATTGNATVALQLTIDGKPAQARFVLPGK